MEFRIEQGPAYELTGLSIATNSHDGSNYINIPAFWDKCHGDGSFRKLLAHCRHRSLGVVGVCHDWEAISGNFTYSIAIETPIKTHGLPDGCRTILVPASTWAKFRSFGPLRPNFQNMIKQIFNEWFPTSGRQHNGGPEIEFYWASNADPQSNDYICEYWVPLK